MEKPEHLSFVPYSRVFLDKSYAWLHDPEIKRLTCTPDFTREQQTAFFESLAIRKDYKVWGIALAEEPIGACGLKHIDGAQAEYWGYIGEKRYWGRGLGQQIIGHCQTMAQSIGLTSLYLKVGADNLRARKLYFKSSFYEEGSDGAGMIRMISRLKA